MCVYIYKRSQLTFYSGINMSINEIFDLVVPFLPIWDFCLFILVLVNRPLETNVFIGASV